MKKGTVGLEAALVAIVLMGVAVIFLALTYKSLFTLAEDEFSEKECQTSLMLTKNLKDLTTISCIQPAPNLALKCSRKFVTVEEDEAFRERKSITNKYDKECPEGYSKKDNECLAESVMAEELAKCWMIFFEGEISVFQQLEKNALNVFAHKNSARVCFICSEVTLKDDSIDDFQDYLERKQFNTELTYFDFIAKNQDAYCDEDLVSNQKIDGDSCWEGIASGYEPKWIDRALKKRLEIETGELKEGKYAITFIRRGMSTCDNIDNFVGTKASEIDEWLMNVARSGVAYGSMKAANGELDPEIFDFYLTQTVHAINADEINQYCDTVIV
ncbi:hypothetical protein GOV11_00135 [Candidatus Woesearchaeota archaeon]|nr:hypothetical protein [Candidatus Woesearchaeota archaeon]